MILCVRHIKSSLINTIICNVHEEMFKRDKCFHPFFIPEVVNITIKNGKVYNFALRIGLYYIDSLLLQQSVTFQCWLNKGGGQGKRPPKTQVPGHVKIRPQFADTKTIYS